jgi:hypothetical protein
MPAIDPDRLTRQVVKVAAAIGDPIELRRRALDLLEFYADRTRRPGPSTQVDDVPPSFGAPRPVMRSLTSSLVRAVAGRRERALAAADALWRADYRETRLLAAALVGSLDDRQAAAWVEDHAALAEDNVVLGEMAGRGLAGWRQADPLGFVDNLTNWLDSSKRPTQHLALLAIIAAVDDPGFRQLPRLFPLLSGRSGSFRGEIRKAYTDSIRALARRSPPEATHFLMAEVASGDPAAFRLARAVLDTLPPDNAGRLRRALPGRRLR